MTGVLVYLNERGKLNVFQVFYMAMENSVKLYQAFVRPNGEFPTDARTLSSESSGSFGSSGSLGSSGKQVAQVSGYYGLKQFR